MKAVAVKPGVKDSVHLVEMDEPKLEGVSGGRGVKVKTLRVGGCGTDREINNAEYGTAPDGADFLVLGHENFGQVTEVGEKVTEFAAGDYVVGTVRRPGKSLYDVIGEQDMTTDSEYFERGISRLHGYFAEFYVESADFLVKLPPTLKEVGVLLEPLSIIEKGLQQAFEIQERAKIWNPRRAAVIGTGSVGLLTVMAMRMRNLEVHAFGKDARAGYLNAELCEEIGATYDSTLEISVADAAKKYGAFDIILEATGYSPIIWDAALGLTKNGVLILTSVTGGNRTAEIPSDKINIEFVLGNKLMFGTVNAGREHFAAGVKDLALCEAMHPEWLDKMLTHPVKGIENFAQMFQNLNGGAERMIKTFCQISD
ncbi:MAG TPA: glucose 1-dehydrogenase [Pyrinomonadaceae bacterium]|nr:glucose 1-dehydrogenase [Pyrinomonadaceae bacterium]